VKKQALFFALAVAGSVVAPMAPAWAANPGGDSAFKLQRKRQFTVAIPRKDPKVKILMNTLIKAFNDQGRFKYVPVEISGASNLDAMVKGVGTFLKAHAANYGGEGEVPDAKFGDVVLTPENVKMMLSSAYLFVPDLYTLPGKDGKPGPTYLDIMVYNVETGAVVKAPTGIKIPFADVLFPDPVKKNPDRAVRVDVAGNTLMPSRIGGVMASTANALSFAFTPFGKKPPTAEDFATREVLTAARKLDSFVLRSNLHGDAQGEKFLPVGQNIGVELDSTFEVQKKVKGPNGFEYQSAGWLKVRKTEGEKSQYQTIAEQTPFEIGDRLVEKPQSGLDFALRLGAAPFDTRGGNALAPAAILGAEYNMAPLTRLAFLSETFITADLTTILNETMFQELPTTGSAMLFGVKKRLTWGQFMLTPASVAGVWFLPRHCLDKVMPPCFCAVVDWAWPPRWALIGN
jgi:hypothetical protein